MGKLVITREEVEQMVYKDLRARYMANLITNEVLIETLGLQQSGMTEIEKRQSINEIEAQNVLLEAQIALVESKIKDEGNEEKKPAK